MVVRCCFLFCGFVVSSRKPPMYSKWGFINSLVKDIHCTIFISWETLLLDPTKVLGAPLYWRNWKKLCDKKNGKDLCQDQNSHSRFFILSNCINLFTMMKTRCGVKQGLWKCWFRLQNEIKTRWEGGLQKRGRFETRLKRGHSSWKRGHSWWTSAETWKTKLKQGGGTPSIFFTLYCSLIINKNRRSI